MELTVTFNGTLYLLKSRQWVSWTIGLPNGALIDGLTCDLCACHSSQFKNEEHEMKVQTTAGHKAQKREKGNRLNESKLK